MSAFKVQVEKIGGCQVADKAVPKCLTEEVEK